MANTQQWFTNNKKIGCALPCYKGGGITIKLIKHLHDIVDFIVKVKKIGISQLCLTNNINKPPPSEINDDNYSARLENVMGNFDHVIESSKLGLRKPDARIYEIAIETLNLSPREIVYFDDLGINLKPASKLGIKTIKVINKEQLLAELRLIFPKVFEDKLVD